MLENLSDVSSKSGIEYCINNEEYYYNSENIKRGVFHAFLIPIILGYFFGVNFAWLYVAGAATLYLTVFRNKPSAKIFFVALFPFACFAVLVLPIIFLYHK